MVFSDVHGNKRACRKLAERADEVDVVVGAGDFGNMREQVRETVEPLLGIEKPTVLVPGNAESREELQDACRDWPAAHVLHGNGVVLEDTPFFGLGGGVPVTPFGPWSYDFTEAEAADLMEDCPQGAVLVSHSPPKGAVDVSSGGASLGSTAVRDTIEKKRIRLCVCGHIHESAGKTEYIGETPVVNAGPKGMIVEP